MNHLQWHDNNNNNITILVSNHWGYGQGIIGDRPDLQWHYLLFIAIIVYELVVIYLIVYEYQFRHLVLLAGI